MIPNRRYGATETAPVHQLEPMVIDCGEGRAIDPTSYGRLETTVVQLPPATFEFAVPELVVSLRFPAAAGPILDCHLALDIYHLTVALSDFEKTLGGRGLRTIDKDTEVGVITLWLAPVLCSECLERLQRLSAAMVDLCRVQSTPANANGSPADALDQVMTSPYQRLKAVALRRGWAIECRVQENKPT
jgi:hypothetical protein